MDPLKNLLNQLTIVQRVSIGAAVLLTAAAIAALVHYRTEADFRPLYTAMAPEDAAPVVQKLKESGVDYRLTDGGGTVLVSSARLADSRLTLAASGLPKSGRIGFELFDKTNFGATELVEHINYQRALEGELERSVMSMAEVVQARVHLTFSRESVFLDQQQPAKASIMIKLRPGAHLSAQNVLALSNLAASAVEGLSPDSVAVIDMDGNLLSRPKRTAAGDSQVTSESLELRQQIEHDLVAKINATLDPLLGADQFRAGASIDCDLTSGDQEEETFNPDQSVMLTSQKSEDVNDRGTSGGGIPGTAANLPNPPARANASAGGTSHKTENVTYQTSRMVRHTKIPQGVVRKMSLSVLVGQSSRWEGTGKNRHRVVVPPAPQTLKTIRDLVAGVTGFDTTRGDQLIVETLPFETTLTGDDPLTTLSPEKPDLRPAWLQSVDKYRNIIFGAVGLLAVLAVVGVMFLRKKTAPGTAVARTDSGELSADDLEALAHERASIERKDEALSAEAHAMLAGFSAETAERVRQFARKDPAVSANVIRMWLHNPQTEAKL